MTIRVQMDAINYRQVAVVDPVGHLHEGHLLLLQNKSGAAKIPSFR